MNSLVAKQVTYEYRNAVQTVKAVNGVSCDFQQGSVYALVGASGSGKTTLMNLIGCGIIFAAVVLVQIPHKKSNPLL